MKKFVSAFSKMASVLSKVAGILLILVALAVCLHIILRIFFNSGVKGIYEIVQYVVLVVVSLTLAENEITGGSVVVSFIIDRMKPRTTNVFSIIMYIITIVGLSVVFYFQVGMITQKYTLGAVSPILAFPHWILVLLICIGLFFFVIAFIIRVYKMIAGHKDIINVKLALEDKAAATKITTEF